MDGHTDARIRRLEEVPTQLIGSNVGVCCDLIANFDEFRNEFLSAEVRCSAVSGICVPDSFPDSFESLTGTWRSGSWGGSSRNRFVSFHPVGVLYVGFLPAQVHCTFLSWHSSSGSTCCPEGQLVAQVRMLCQEGTNLDATRLNDENLEGSFQLWLD